jgi:ribosomal protein S18 acetylase RimI-like enzyme
MNIVRVKSPSSPDITVELLRDSRISLPRLKEVIEMDDSVALIARENGNSAGMCVVEKRPEGYELIHLCVAPLFRRQSIAREVLAHSMDYVRVLGGQVLTAGAANSDLTAFTVLQKLGFRVTGVYRDHYRSGREVTVDELGVAGIDMLRYEADLRELAT